MSRKPWKEMTDAEIDEIKRKKCQFCVYSIKFGAYDKRFRCIMCNYCSKEGHSRGCRPDECDKYKPRLRRRRKE